MSKKEKNNWKISAMLFLMSQNLSLWLVNRWLCCNLAYNPRNIIRLLDDVGNNF